MTGWTEFAAASTVFMLSHVVPSRSAIRARLVRGVGESGFLIGYGAVSLAALVWLIGAAGRAPYVGVWSFQPWQMWVPVLTMPFAAVLLSCSLGAPNPLSFGGARAAAFEPSRPGVVGIVRHPVLWALALWAGAHLAPNGDGAHVALFGLFLAFALAGQVLIDRRKRRLWGDGEWRRLAFASSIYPLAAWLDGRWKPDWRRFPLLRVSLGLALYVGAIALHPYVIGVSPLPAPL